MADDAPSAMDWLRGQLRRKPAGDGEAAPGIRGLRPSKGMGIVLVLSVLVVIFVLTSKNGGTPATNAANSSSPEASPSVGPTDQPGTSSDDPTSTAKPTAGKRSPSGKTAYTRQRVSDLTVREQPSPDSDAVDRLVYDSEVTLVCHTEGPAVYGFNGRSSRVWDKVKTANGKTGYVPDGWVATDGEVSTQVESC